MIFKNDTLKKLKTRDWKGAYPCKIGEDGRMNSYFLKRLIVSFAGVSQESLREGRTLRGGGELLLFGGFLAVLAVSF